MGSDLMWLGDSIAVTPALSQQRVNQILAKNDWWSHVVVGEEDDVQVVDGEIVFVQGAQRSIFTLDIEEAQQYRSLIDENLAQLCEAILATKGKYVITGKLVWIGGEDGVEGTWWDMKDQRVRREAPDLAWSDGTTTSSTTHMEV